MKIREVPSGSDEFVVKTEAVKAFAKAKGVDLPANAPYKTLREWREFLGGDTAQLSDPDGHKHTVSLVQWAGADPDSTMLAISFVRAAGPGAHMAGAGL